MTVTGPHQFNESSDIFDLRSTSLEEIFYSVNQITPLSYIKDKTHLFYLKEYFSSANLSATFVVVERGFINKDYLTDFSAYYSTCFESYSKLCARLHFFNNTCDKEQFLAGFKASIIEGINKNQSHKKFWKENYIGFITVKPTPTYFIGFTLLNHYNFNPAAHTYKASRNYWGVKDYKMHLYGNEVVLSCLAFQEQDRNVAACASIAIWSMLQRAAEDYYVVLQSPGEITSRSGLVDHNGNRLIPNKGLSILQMAQAITQNNMATEVRLLDDYRGFDPINVYLKKLIRAYSNLKIPIILGVNVPLSSTEHDRHAVAVCGDNMQSIQSIERKSTLFQIFSKRKEYRAVWMADRIDKVYVHDDQWGPFATMSFSRQKSMKSNWDKKNKTKKGTTPEAIVISVYPKVRIAYEDIEDKVLGLDTIFKHHLKNQIKGTFIWDIQLFLSEDFKTTIQQSENLDDSDETDKKIQFKFLTRSFPKYIWVATLNISESTIFHFIYDATGLSGSNLIHTVIGFYPFLTDFFAQILETNKDSTNNELTSIFDNNVPYFLSKIREFSIS